MHDDHLNYFRQDNIFVVPIVHYNMEMATQVCLAFEQIKPDCVAVEFAETMQLQLLHAASRLPDISVVEAYDRQHQPIFYMCEPCDPGFEALRSGLEAGIPSFCIDLDVDYYPDQRDSVPDPYAINRIGLKMYYEAYEKAAKHSPKSAIDQDREMHMARKLKELSLTYDKVLFVCGMSHMQNVLSLMKRSSFPDQKHAQRTSITLQTPTEESCRDVMAECGWFSTKYEIARAVFKAHQIDAATPFPPDRQQLIFTLYKQAAEKYTQSTGNEFAGYNMRNLMKFARNYALVNNQLMPDLYKILSAAKACADHNYAYFVWELATEYAFRKNIDGLPESNFTIEDIWKNSKLIRFHLKQQSRKSFQQRHKKSQSQFRFQPPGMFSICSYPKEDVVVENFGEFLKKKGKQILLDESSRTIPFTTSLESGVDIKETIRHWYEKKLYVKTQGRPPGGVGSIVVIFDEDSAEEGKKNDEEKYPWRTTWLGEHEQESDMALYATPISAKVIGPGISRCEYGGFMMSYPPRRMMDVWTDDDYADCRTKAEVLLMAAIDYAVQPIVVYVASKPPRSAMKSFAQRFGKKVVYIPIGQLSAVMLNKIRVFHVLDGRNRRDIADEYIF